MVIDFKKKLKQKQDELQKREEDTKAKMENYDSDSHDKFDNLLEKLLDRSKKFIIGFFTHTRRR